MKTQRHDGAGFTLVEMLVSMTVLAVVVGSVLFSLSRASGVYGETQTRDILNANAHRALEFVARQFMDAGRGEFVPLDPDCASDITYRRADGYDGAATTFGPVMRFAFQLDEEELDDGLDNNQNGLVDEGVILWVEDVGGPNERGVVRARGVSRLTEGELPNGVDDNGNGVADEAGFHFEIAGDVLTVRVTMERLDASGRLLTKTVQTSVNVRN